MQDYRAMALATTALVGIAMASATVQAADYTVPSDLLSDVQGYIDTAGNDDLKSRWEAAYATLTGNIEWVPAQEVEVKDDVYGDYTKIVEGYWGVKGKDGMRAITLGSASLYADLHKSKRWRPVKQAIRKLLRNDMYGIAMVVEVKPFYEQWGAWGNLSSALQTGVKGLDSPEYLVEALNKGWLTDDQGETISDGTYGKFAELPPVQVGSSTSYKFTAAIGQFDVQSLTSKYNGFHDLALEFDYTHGNGQWGAKLKGFGQSSQGSQSIGRRWNDLQWNNGMLAQTSADGDGDSLLTGQFYRRDTSHGMITINGKEHTQYPYRIAGGVITPDLAAVYMTESVVIPDTPN